MDCVNWYYNTSTVMVNCPTQPYCCDDAQCYNSTLGVENWDGTTNACWAQEGGICTQDYLAKHEMATCDTPMSNLSVPNAYDAGNWSR